MDFLEIAEEVENSTNIKVIGVGGGGSNAVQNMVQASLQGVTLIAANTDVQALKRSNADYTIQLGNTVTKGLGAGADPNVGREAALESIDAIKECIGNADMVFVTAGMGGGTGTGAAPIIAQAAREAGALTVGIVTKPFFFEGRQRLEAAERGIQEFRQCVDSLITIPNDRLVSLAPKRATFLEMLKKADEVLYHAVKGISDLITLSGVINLDFRDVKRVMGESGLAMMGTGVATGESRAREAAMRAITSPLLEDVSMDGARSVLYNITSGLDVTLDEISEAGAIIQEAAHPDATIIFGAVFDENAGDELSITVIATGIEPTSNGFNGKGSNVSSFPKASSSQAPSAPSQGAQASAQPAQISATSSPAPVSPKPEAQPKVQPLQPQQTYAPYGQPNRDMQGRGVNYGTMSADDLNVPTCLRSQGQTTPFRTTKGHVPGGEDFIFDEDEMELPTFVRRQAD